MRNLAGDFRNIEIKIFRDMAAPDLTIKMIEDLNLAETRSIRASFDMEHAKEMLQERYNCSSVDTISGGCFGARDGSIHEGLTIWLSSYEIDCEYTDSNGAVLTNVTRLLNQYDGELVLNDEGDALPGEDFEAIAEQLGLKVQADNSYNRDNKFLFDFDFAIIKSKNDSAFLSIKMHCGGDIRGNYTNKYVFKFDSIADVYDVVYGDERDEE